MLSPTQDNETEDLGDDWALPPSPAPENRLPKRSKLDGLVEVECAIKPLGFSSIRAFNSNPHSHQHRGLPQHDPGVLRAMEMQQAARLARLERTKAEAAAIIAAAAAAQKAAEERALVEAAAAAEQLSKEEERNADRERRRKDRKDKERGEKRRGEDNREKRLLKLVGAVVVKTMSKYRTRMDVDTFKKHAKEVLSLSFVPYCFADVPGMTYSLHISLRRRRKSRRATRTISSILSRTRRRPRSKSSPESISTRSYTNWRRASAVHQIRTRARPRSRGDTTPTRARQRHHALYCQRRRCRERTVAMWIWTWRRWR